MSGGKWGMGEGGGGGAVVRKVFMSGFSWFSFDRRVSLPSLSGM